MASVVENRCLRGQLLALFFNTASFCPGLEAERRPGQLPPKCERNRMKLAFDLCRVSPSHTSVSD